MWYAIQCCFLYLFITLNPALNNQLLWKGTLSIKRKAFFALCATAFSLARNEMLEQSKQNGSEHIQNRVKCANALHPFTVKTKRGIHPQRENIVTAKTRF